MSEREYVRKQERVTAVQWNKPGDHPDVAMAHGLWCVPVGRGLARIWIEPGDWIVSHEDGRTSALTDKTFRREYEPVPLADLGAQILALAELKDGWLDGEGKAYDPAALARVAAIAERLAAIASGRVYPSPDGKVVLEWGGRPHDDSLEIDPATGRMEFHLFDHDTGATAMGVVAPEDDA